MKLVFYSKFYPRTLRNEYLRLSRNGLAAAADAHQYALAQGFSRVCDNFEIVNLPALYPFPFRYKRMIVKNEVIEENGLKINNIGFNNLAFFQNYSRYTNAIKFLKQPVESYDGLVWIVIYSTNISFLASAVYIKRHYNNVRLCMIVPDIPDDIAKSSFSGRISNWINQLGFSSFNAYCYEMDAFVLLTNQMSERIPGCRGKYIVSEGVYDETGCRRITNVNKCEVSFTVLYSGMLNKKFGIMNLVYAIHKLNDPSVSLQLYGTGDCVKDIRDIAEIDPHIVYNGVVDRDVVLQKQSEASLLVNPRIPDDNPYTRYSFPSKTLEYLASGTPTLLYELDGIPNEYYNYCYHLDKKHTDIDSLCKEIVRIKELPVSERCSLANRARRFVIENKGPESMCMSIFSFLNRIYKETNR